MKPSVTLHQAGLKGEAGQEKSTENQRNRATAGNQAGSMEEVPGKEVAVMPIVHQTEGQ